MDRYGSASAETLGAERQVIVSQPTRSVRPRLRGLLASLGVWRAVLWTVCLPLFPGLGQAQAPVVTSAQDTYLKEGTPNKNQGAETVLSIRQSGSHRSLVLFDQVEIASAVGTSTLTAAKLRLTIVSNGNNWGSGGGVAAHRLTQSWSELGATWNCPDDTNTGNSSPDCTQWDMDGTPQFPFLTTPTDVVLHQNGQQGVVEWNVTADVAAFLAGTPNHGWVIKKADESESGLVEYSSREGTFVPELILELNGTPAPPPVINPDTYLKKGTPNKNQGSETILRVRQSGPNRALVRFDQTDIENRVGAGTLLSAKLRLTIVSNGNNWGSTGGEVGVHRMTQTWTEYGATWNCPDDINTSNSSADCAEWDMNGNTQFPFVVTPTATALQVNGQEGAVEWDVIADVQAFLAGTANHGWLVKKVEENQSGRMDYSSREGAFPPELVLEVSGGGVPSDTEPPTITATLTPEPNANGWNNTDVVISFDCQDADSGVATCPAPVVITTEGAAQEVEATAEDQAGNVRTIIVNVNIDKTPPAVAPAVSPEPNQNGWNNTNVTVSFGATDNLSGVASVAPPLGISSEGAGQLVDGAATDFAGNSTQASVNVNLDKSSPIVSINTPNPGAILRTVDTEVSGTVSEALSGVAGGTCNGSAASVSSSAFSCQVTLVDGGNSINVGITDLAGNVGAARIGVSVIQAPLITITSPAPLSLLNASPITVSGTVSGSPASVIVNGVQASGGTSFTAAGIGLNEGANTITAVATDAAGNVSMASIVVFLDTSAPGIIVDSPTDGAILSEPTVDVVGRLDDIAAATAASDGVTVTVNGTTADVTNLTFVVSDVPLRLGSNSIVITAQDTAGNSNSRVVNVTRRELVGQRIRRVSGNDQLGVVGATLPNPLVVALFNSNGSPAVGRAVTFRVTRGDGSLSSAGQTGRTIDVLTDNTGQAEVSFTLGTRSGAGNHQVTASARGFVGEASFRASASSGPPTEIKVVVGENQRGVIGEPLARPLTVIVHDESGNPVAGVPVLFEAAQGGGNFQGSTSITRPTGPDGRISVVLALGPEAGVNNNVVQASFPGLVGLPAVFFASGVVPGSPAATRVSGVVLDNSNIPVEGVTASIAGSSLQAVTDDQGQFSIPNVAVGTHHLIVDGSTTTRPGTWAGLEFEINVVSGIDNTIGMPIFLLPLDTDNAKVVGGPDDVTLTLRDVPGFSMTVFANSATFPDGSQQGDVMVTQVHSDKVPMPPQEGAAPRLVVTIQPPGVRFDPPARVTYPNVFGLNPGQVVNLFSFDHDLGEYVNVGTGSVSEDGSLVVSDPGVGIRQAGWHIPPAPPPPTTCAKPIDVELSGPRFLIVGQTGTLEGSSSLEDGSQGCPAVGGTFTWTNSDTAIVSGADGVTDNPVSVTGASPGTSNITVTYEAAGKTATRSAEVNVGKLEMTAFRPQTEPFQRRAVPDDEEESPGVGIRVNGDDDNNNGNPDRNETSVGSENDLIEVTLEVDPVTLPEGNEYVLKRISGDIKVWSAPTKGSAVLEAEDEIVLTFTGNTRTVWAESPGGGGILELQVRDSQSKDVLLKDRVNFFPFTSIVIAIAGDGQVPVDPADTNLGTFRLAIDLYEEGYDVHMFNEDVVATDGSGPAFDEVADAVRDRNVRQVAAFGYSQGGGSTHDLLERLAANRTLLGDAFIVSFAAYVDAITNAGASSETRRPADAVFLANYFQRQLLIEQGFLRGNRIDTPGANFECNVNEDDCGAGPPGWGSDLHHRTIDDHLNVLGGIRSLLVARVPK